MQACKPAQKILRRLTRRGRQESGQALVEFAIVLPVLILIILGILYFGRYENYSNQETQLAEEGARWAAVDNNPSTTQTLQSYIQAQAQPELANGSSDVSAARVYLYCPTGTCTSVNTDYVIACVTTTVQYPFLKIGSGIVTESATMRIEQAQTTAEWTPATPPAGLGCPTS
jgi:Flp pilus assembly protein TadG